MSIRHHLSDDLLLSYAAGTLAEAWSLAVATHLGLCPDCREREARFAAIGGAALEAFAPESISDDALARCLAQLDEIAPEPAPAPAALAITSSPPVLPQPLRDYVGGDAATIRWSMVGGGIRQHLIGIKGDARARLLYIPAGETVPSHGHRGLELTLVLAGSFHNGHDEFWRGDIELADESVNHTPVAGMAEPCICLAVTDAPLRFERWLPRLVQRFTKI